MHRATQVIADHVALREMGTHVGAVRVEGGHTAARAAKQNHLVAEQVPGNDLTDPDRSAAANEVPRTRRRR